MTKEAPSGPIDVANNRDSASRYNDPDPSASWWETNSWCGYRESVTGSHVNDTVIGPGFSNVLKAPLTMTLDAEDAGLSYDKDWNDHRMPELNRVEVPPPKQVEPPYDPSTHPKLEPEIPAWRGIVAGPLYGVSGIGQTLLWVPRKIGLTKLIGAENYLERCDRDRETLRNMIWTDNGNSVDRATEIILDASNVITAGAIVSALVIDVAADLVTDKAVEVTEEVRAQALSWDPDIRNVRPRELEGALRLEEHLGLKLERAPDAGDFIGPDGAVFDLVGPFPPEHADKIDMAKLLQSINNHVNKKPGVDKAVIDLTGLNKEQIDAVLAFIKNLSPDKIILLGL